MSEIIERRVHAVNDFEIGSNHWGTPELELTLKKLASAYGNEFPGSKLAINDMSLPWGGIFDLGPTAVCKTGPPQVMGVEWGPCHAWHRFGKDVDINLVPRANRARLKDLAKNRGLRFVHGGSHWHFEVK